MVLIAKGRVASARPSRYSISFIVTGNHADRPCICLVRQDSFAKLPVRKDDEEEVLQMAWGLSPT